MKRIFGFTLIETIVVIAVIGLTLPVIFSIFFVLFREQTKIYRLNTVKKEGDYIINVMENTIKNKAIMTMNNNSPIPPDSTNTVCATDASDYGVSPTVSSLYFLDQNGKWFGYIFGAQTISSNSASLTSPVDLTSNKTIISNFSISCMRKYKFSQQLISISFNICYKIGTDDCTSSRSEETASLHYQTRIKLRNY